MNKQQLQQEIAELQKQLEEKQKALAATPDKWEPKGGDFYVSSEGDAVYAPSCNSTRVFGTEYNTMEQAEKAAKAMRAHNRLLAYVAEFVPDYEPSWNDGEFCIEYYHDSAEFDVEVNFGQRLGAVYMPKHVAVELCEKLNSGEVEL